MFRCTVFACRRSRRDNHILARIATKQIGFWICAPFLFKGAVFLVTMLITKLLSAHRPGPGYRVLRAALDKQNQLVHYPPQSKETYTVCADDSFMSYEFTLKKPQCGQAQKVGRFRDRKIYVWGEIENRPPRVATCT